MAHSVSHVGFVPAGGRRLGESWGGVLSHTHTCSARFESDPRSQPPACYEHMVRWCRDHHVRAVGMGSPYTPASARVYARYDQDPAGREAYYSGQVDPRTLCCRDEHDKMLRQANRAGADKTLFFLDNETPKGRFGHLWWVGYTCEFPAWHDYDQTFDRWMTGAMEPSDTSDEPMGYERRPYREIVACQRRSGGLGVWAHPTSWWFSGEGDKRRFITNIATEMPAHCMADGFLDGMVIMGYHPWRPEYIAIWEAMLDRGYRAPATAEMDTGLHPATLDKRRDVLLSQISPNSWNITDVVAEFKAGRICASSGPRLDLTIDGQPMGSVARTAADKLHRVRIEAVPAPGEEELGCIELIGQGGKLLWRSGSIPAGTHELTLPGSDSRGYCYARAFGEGISAAPADHSPKFAAISNPVYLHPRGQGFTPPMQTELEIVWKDHSSWRDGRLTLETPDGQTLETFAVESAGLTFTAPANGRLRFVGPDDREQTEYLINANAPLQDVQRYLYRGRFLRDFNVESGEVPVDAWRLDDYRRCIEHMRLSR